MGTVGSLNSLRDGRTPWPIPWIEAIFLPEYPNRGHVTEASFNVHFPYSHRPIS